MAKMTYPARTRSAGAGRVHDNLPSQARSTKSVQTTGGSKPAMNKGTKDMGGSNRTRNQGTKSGLGMAKR